MKVSKYLYVYLSLALLLVSSLFLEERKVKTLFIIITILLFLVLIYDFISRNLIYKRPSFLSLSFDILVLAILLICLSDVFDLRNVFVVAFIISYILKMFYLEKHLDTSNSYKQK